MNLQKEKWFQRIMESEGGLNMKEPASVGGKSYAGISQKTYEKWRQNKSRFGNPPQEVEELAGNTIGTEYEKQNPFDIPEGYGVRTDIIEAFYLDYFKLARLEILPECLKYIHADFFVNAGFNANKILQRMVGFTSKKDIDGALGPASRQRIKELKDRIKTDLSDDPTADDDAIMDYHQRKLDHYESIFEKNPDLYNANIKGWRKRAQHILSGLGEYFVDEEPTTSAVLDESDHADVFEIEEDSVVRDQVIKEVTEKVKEQLLKNLPKYIEQALMDQKNKLL